VLERTKGKVYCGGLNPSGSTKGGDNREITKGYTM